jgi:hypothetical protein
LSEASDHFAARGQCEFFKFAKAFFELDKGISFESDTNNDNAFLRFQNRFCYRLISFLAPFAEGVVLSLRTGFSSASLWIASLSLTWFLKFHPIFFGPLA